MRFYPLKQLIVGLTLVLAGGFTHAGEITVSAASSLTDAFREIAKRYEAQHPGSRVALNFGASGALLQQVAKGAPVDVLASADQETMDLAEQQKLVSTGTRRNFARNTLVVIVPADGAAPIASLHDLAAPTVARVAIGNPASVPVGRYAQRALEAAGVWTALKDKRVPTDNVRQALDYVARGEVDAGFVYATDAKLMPQQVKVALRVPLDVDILYPIASIAGSTHTGEAKRFIDFVLSPAGQAVLRQYGFQAP